MSNYRDHFDAEIERAAREITETGARVAALQSRNGPMTGRSTSTDGAITVTVTPGGNLVDVQIENSALTMHPDELAAELVRLAGKATRDAGARMHASLRPVVGPEVTRGLTALGIHPGAGEDADDEETGMPWDGVLRRPV
jgi:DNA-binding protein YbaB